LYNWVLHWANTPYGTPALCALSFAESSFFPIPPDVLLIALGISRRRRSFYYAAVCSVASVVGGIFGYFIGWALWNPVGAPILRSLHLLTHDHRPVVVQTVEPSSVSVRPADETPFPVSRWSVMLGTIRKPAADDPAGPLTLHRWLVHRDEPVAGTRVGAHEYESAQTAGELRPGQTAYFMTDTYHQARALYEKYDFWIVFAAAFTPIPYKVFTILSGLMQMQLLPFLLASAIGRSARFFLVSALIFVFGEPIRRFIDRYFNLLSVLFLGLLVFFFLILQG